MSVLVQSLRSVIADTVVVVVVAVDAGGGSGGDMTVW